jgi:mRNA interferase MazF
MNHASATVIIAPMTTVCRGWPSRILVEFQNKTGEIALDQLRTVDKSRLTKKLGKLDNQTTANVLEALGEMFAP